MKTIITITALLLTAASPALAQPDEPMPAPDPDPMAEPPPPEAEPDPGADLAPVTATSSLAADPSARGIGVGIGFTIAGNAAITGTKYISPELGVQAGLTIDYTSFDINLGGMTDTATFLSLGGAAYGYYRLLTLGDVALNGAGGLEVAYTSFDSGLVGGSSSGVDIFVAAGGQLEWWVSKHLTVWAQSGLTFAVLGDVTAPISVGSLPGGAADASGIRFDLGPRDGRQIFGMTWWMN